MPAVSLATAAPAHAATSTGGLRLLVNATYQWTVVESSIPWYGMVPTITIENLTSVPSGQVILTLYFPVATFHGDGPRSSRKAPMSISTHGNLSAGSWSNVALQLPKVGDTEVLMQYSCRSPGIGAGQSSTFGNPTGANAYGLVFTNQPDTDVAMSVHASASGFVDTAGVMTRLRP
ncbi:MAG: hypothetical protein QM747_11910 [Nocardioides sp.]